MNTQWRQGVYAKATIFDAQFIYHQFFTETGKSLIQVISGDSMPIDQHIHLRKLIIAWSKNANRDE